MTKLSECCKAEVKDISQFTTQALNHLCMKCKERCMAIESEPKSDMNIKLNGFNNGRDTTEGVGGKPPYYESEPTDKAEEILNNILYPENGLDKYDTMIRSLCLKAMQEYADEQTKHQEHYNELLIQEIEKLKASSKDGWSDEDMKKAFEAGSEYENAMSYGFNEPNYPEFLSQYKAEKQTKK